MRCVCVCVWAGRQDGPRLATPPLYRRFRRHFESTWRHTSTTSDNPIRRWQSVVAPSTQIVIHDQFHVILTYQCMQTDKQTDRPTCWSQSFTHVHWNDFELVLTVKMETRHPIEGPLGSEFPAICNHCVVTAAWNRKTLQFLEILRFFRKNDPLR